MASMKLPNEPDPNQSLDDIAEQGMKEYAIKEKEAIAQEPPKRAKSPFQTRRRAVSPANGESLPQPPLSTSTPTREEPKRQPQKVFPERRNAQGYGHKVEEPEPENGGQTVCLSTLFLVVVVSLVLFLLFYNLISSAAVK